jgi:chromate reductase
MTSVKVGYFVGSLAMASINRLLAKALVRVATRAADDGNSVQGLAALLLRLRRELPSGRDRIKNAIAAVDAVLFVTPEYNRSIPGGLKNAIDWASRPYGQNAFTRKRPR